MKQIIIIGNGIAGISAANEIRRLDSNAKVTIVSKEYDHFFSRTALMYEFCGQLNRKDLEPYERNHYQLMNFNRISDEAISVDPVKQKVYLKNNQPLEYDYLLLACGSVPVKLPWQTNDLENVGHFVSIQDLEWWKENAQHCLDRDKKNVAIIGGGLIGIETTEILALGGFNVHFLIMQEWFWPVALNAKESKHVAENMRSHGVNVMLETVAEEAICSENQLSGFKLNTGEVLEVDLAMITIGLSPQTAWLKDSGIKLSEDRFQAVEANNYLQTNFSNIYAAGDCANVTWFNGVRRPEQLWYTGRDQGLVVAKNICGQQTKYARDVLYNSAKLFDIEYTTAGLVNFPLEALSEWYQEHDSLPVTQRIVIQNNKVIGFNMLGSRWNHQYFIDWIKEERDLDYVLTNMEQARFDAEFTDQFRVLDTATTYAL